MPIHGSLLGRVLILKSKKIWESKLIRTVVDYNQLNIVRVHESILIINRCLDKCRWMGGQIGGMLLYGWMPTGNTEGILKLDLQLL